MKVLNMQFDHCCDSNHSSVLLLISILLSSLGLGSLVVYMLVDWMLFSCHILKYL